MWLLLEQEQNCWRILYRAPKAKPGIQRDLAHGLRWHIAQVHCYHAKSARLDQQIHSAQSLVDILAAHPKEFFERYPGRIRRQRIKTVARVHQRADFSIFRSRS